MRVNFLDGLRGWAALMVVLSHLFNFLSINRPEYKLPIFAFASNGHLAVLIFFVLSGYALSINRLNKRIAVVSLIISRYFRLLIPIFLTSLLTYIFIKNGFFLNQEVYETNILYQTWIGSFFKFETSLADLLQFSFYDVFFNYDPEHTYNSSLWTMYDEICGSILIFLYLHFIRKNIGINLKAWIPLTLFLMFKRPDLSCFMMGYAIAELNRFKSTIFNLKEFHFLVCFAITVIALSFYTPNWEWINCLSAAFLVFLVSYSSQLRFFFQNTISSYLGKISFTLYLIQITVICSLSSYLYLKLPTLGIDLSTSSDINFLCSITVCLFVANYLTFIDRLSINSSKWIYEKTNLFFIHASSSYFRTTQGKKD